MLNTWSKKRYTLTHTALKTHTHTHARVWLRSRRVQRQLGTSDRVGCGSHTELMARPSPKWQLQRCQLPLLPPAAGRLPAAVSVRCPLCGRWNWGLSTTFCCILTGQTKCSRKAGRGYWPKYFISLFPLTLFSCRFPVSLLPFEIQIGCWNLWEKKKTDELVGNFALVDSVRGGHNGRVLLSNSLESCRNYEGTDTAYKTNKYSHQRPPCGELSPKKKS